VPAYPAFPSAILLSTQGAYFPAQAREAPRSGRPFLHHHQYAIVGGSPLASASGGSGHLSRRRERLIECAGAERCTLTAAVGSARRRQDGAWRCPHGAEMSAGSHTGSSAGQLAPSHRAGRGSSSQASERTARALRCHLRTAGPTSWVLTSRASPRPTAAPSTAALRGHAPYPRGGRCCSTPPSTPVRRNRLFFQTGWYSPLSFGAISSPAQFAGARRSRRFLAATKSSTNIIALLSRK
jgi:hypothetical protein